MTTTHRNPEILNISKCRIPLLSSYFKWLDNNAPNGKITSYPLVSHKGESEIPGIYIAGDLTGVPLLKLAADGGKTVVDTIVSDSAFLGEQKKQNNKTYDLVIVGAGIAGLSAAISASEKGLDFIVLEANRTFSTIRNFPAGKPITKYPLDSYQDSELLINGENKEELLEDLEKQLDGYDFSIHTGESMISVEGENGNFTVKTNTASYNCLHILLAIGKSGEGRRLGVDGEENPKVLSRLIDPADFADKRILVVGGGDSALENALLLAEQKGTVVSLSYRGSSFTRPKSENISKILNAVEQGKINLFLGSSVTKIDDLKVTLKTGNKSIEIDNDIVFTLIGHKLPVALLDKTGIHINKIWTTQTKILFATLLFFAAMLYFGKSSSKTNGESILEVLSAPAVFLSRPWDKSVIGIIGWISLWGFLISGIITLGIVGKKISKIFKSNWSVFKTLYFLCIGIFITLTYITDIYLKAPLADKHLGFWYTFLYSLTILIFGLRRIAVRNSKYITNQTTVLISVQILFLFLLPEFILPWMGEHGLVSAWLIENFFPGESYWRSYGFVLAWPLFFSNLMYGQPTNAWLILSLVQTFIIIPFFVWRFGKGAYCGWICSCGGLAETLGDEYRTLATHGKKARSLEHVGQVILIVVLALTIWNLTVPSFQPEFFSNLRKVYKILIDIGLAGVVGVGVYFFLSGRVWCRFFCPLAALMHIYTKFSVFRIFSDKKKCISCGLCTRICHMGIDVMGYANKGRPMDNYECVRCSSCINTCPVSCLEFGSITDK